jgi:8-oxo-dGTP diphosphatase
MIEIPFFGEATPGLAVIERPGAYALILDECAHLAVIRLPEGWYLPGGGIEAGESLKSCLQREVLEETGMRIHILWHLGKSGQYMPYRGQILLKLGNFFVCEIQSKNETSLQTETNHELHWLTLTEASTLLKHPFQTWAVKELSGCISG